jgi:hypothetical protein
VRLDCSLRWDGRGVWRRNGAEQQLRINCVMIEPKMRRNKNTLKSSRVSFVSLVIAEDLDVTLMVFGALLNIMMTV